MEKSIWDRLNDLSRSINGGVEPMDEIKLPTNIVKKFLGIFLLQSIFIALIWSITNKSVAPWIIPLSSFLQVGWIWNKVTESWKLARGYYNRIIEESYLTQSTTSINPPNLDLKTSPVFGNQNIDHPLFNSNTTDPLMSISESSV